MSNNIQSWKTKKLEKFSFPLHLLYDTNRADWLPPAPVIMNTETMEIEINGDDGLEVVGTLDGNRRLNLKSINNTGEGSGTFYGELLYTALEHSSGELEAILIYENSTIWKLHVKDGVVTETEIEL